MPVLATPIASLKRQLSCSILRDYSLVRSTNNCPLTGKPSNDLAKALESQMPSNQTASHTRAGLTMLNADSFTTVAVAHQLRSKRSVLLSTVSACRSPIPEIWVPEQAPPPRMPIPQYLKLLFPAPRNVINGTLCSLKHRQVIPSLCFVAS